LNEQVPDRAWFSPLLNQIADVAGVRAALLIGRDKSCQRIYIPKPPVAHDHWLVQLVGDEAANKIAKRWGGHGLDIPPALGGQMRRRRRAIAEMTTNGMSINRISRALGVARSTVTDQRRKMDRPPATGDLFPSDED